MVWWTMRRPALVETLRMADLWEMRTQVDCVTQFGSGVAVGGLAPCHARWTEWTMWCRCSLGDVSQKDVAISCKLSQRWAQKAASVSAAGSRRGLVMILAALSSGVGTEVGKIAETGKEPWALERLGASS